MSVIIIVVAAISSGVYNCVVVVIIVVAFSQCSGFRAPATVRSGHWKFGTSAHTSLIFRCPPFFRNTLPTGSRFFVRRRRHCRRTESLDVLRFRRVLASTKWRM